MCWGWGILVGFQPSLPINLMSCRGHVRESFQWIPGMELPFGWKSPKRSSVLWKSTHEHLLWTMACPERTESRSQLRASFFLPPCFPRTGAGTQKVTERPSAPSLLCTGDHQTGDYHLPMSWRASQQGRAIAPTRLHQSPPSHQTQSTAEAVYTPTLSILILCSQMPLLGTLRSRGWGGGYRDGVRTTPDVMGRKVPDVLKAHCWASFPALGLLGEIWAEGSSKDSWLLWFPFSLRKDWYTITASSHRPHSRSHLAVHPHRAVGLRKNPGAHVEYPECSQDKGEKRHPLHVHLYWPGSSSSTGSRYPGQQLKGTGSSSGLFSLF